MLRDFQNGHLAELIVAQSAGIRAVRLCGGCSFRLRARSSEGVSVSQRHDKRETSDVTWISVEESSKVTIHNGGEIYLILPCLPDLESSRRSYCLIASYRTV
jgi:hypothetical protein